MKKQTFEPPAEHGCKLIEPSGKLLKSLCSENFDRQVVVADRMIGSQSLASLRDRARMDLLQAAVQYSNQYLERPVDVGNSDRLIPIVMAGHQPELFHPGVWFKNFVLSTLSGKQSAIAINLVVDNDLCTQRGMVVPVGDRFPVGVKELPIDQQTATVPFEGARIIDGELFNLTGARVEAAVKGLIDKPIIAELWPEVRCARERLKIDGSVNYGLTLAAGRHRLEAKWGLQTLEVPVSRLSRCDSFANFAWEILSDAERFANLHNQGLLEYRRLYALRSKTHPFPDLGRREDWIESPFWVFDETATQRNRLFVRTRASKLEMSDLAGWTASPLAGVAEFKTQIAEQNLRIRPRALTTTLFSRLLLSDLFIHGTGGGRYDQLTDWLAEQFWKIRLPGFAVASATYKLFPDYPKISVSQILQQKQQLRDLEMNPDRFLASVDNQAKIPAEIRSAVETKQAWIRGEQTGSGQERHAAIAKCNLVLKQWSEPLKLKLLAKIEADQEQLNQEQSLGSREFSFCLHPIDLIEQLLQY